MTSWPLWALIGVLGSVTFATRVAFFLRPPAAHGAPADPLDGPDQAAAPAEPRLLRYVSPAMLSALLVPALLGRPETPWPFSHALAGLGALAIALWSATHPTWRSATVLLTLLVGWGTLWLLTLAGW